MLKIVEYWKISKIFEQCLKISEKCRKFSKKFKKSNVEKCRKMLKNVEKCGKMSKNVENYTKGAPCSALSPIQTNCSLRFSRTPPPRTNCDVMWCGPYLGPALHRAYRGRGKVGPFCTGLGRELSVGGPISLERKPPISSKNPYKCWDFLILTQHTPSACCYWREHPIHLLPLFL